MRFIYGLAASLVALPAFAQTAIETPGLARPTPGLTQPVPAEGLGQSGVGRAAVAESACLQRLQQVVPRLERTLDRADRDDLRQMRETAIIFARRGSEPSCEAVVVEIERIAEQNRTVAQPDPALRRERLTQARPFAPERLIRASDLMDSEVVTLEDEEIGEVEDVILAPGPQGQIYAIVDRGGWFNVGEEQIAIPLSILRMTDDDEVVVATPIAVIEEAPQIEAEDFENAERLRDVETYWAGAAR